MRPYSISQRPMKRIGASVMALSVAIAACQTVAPVSHYPLAVPSAFAKEETNSATIQLLVDGNPGPFTDANRYNATRGRAEVTLRITNTGTQVLQNPTVTGPRGSYPATMTLAPGASQDIKMIEVVPEGETADPTYTVEFDGMQPLKASSSLKNDQPYEVHYEYALVPNGKTTIIDKPTGN